jgi:predicted AAA+ superfamily ATPase
MPHGRARHASKIVEKALSHSPLVGILGQRQVGKTTLVSALTEEYTTLDNMRDLELATQNPELFIENRKHPFGIDEAQLCPPLFPALKEWVRVHPKKGQVILTGSVRFTSRKAIRESLTGRIVNVEVIPLTISELNGSPLTNFMDDLMNTETTAAMNRLSKSYSSKKATAFAAYLEKGGLPGICFFRDASVRKDRFEAHIDTLLQRDLQLIIQTTTTSVQLKNIARFIAENQGYPFSLQDASRYSGISTITVKKLLIALEGLFLVRAIPCEGSVAKPSYYFEDQGLASFCANTPFQKTTDILRGIYANLRQELFYSKTDRGEIFSFRTHDGTDVPLVFRRSKSVLGIIPVEGNQISRKALESARSFLNHYRNGKIVYAHEGKFAFTKDFSSFAIPYWWLV